MFMVKIEHNRGKTYEVQLPEIMQKKIELPPFDIEKRVREAYLKEQQVLHPGVPERVGLGERLVRKIIGERRKEVRI